MMIDRTPFTDEANSEENSLYLHKIILCSKLLVHYMMENDVKKMNKFVHQIVKLVYFNDIIGILFRSDLEEAINQIKTGGDKNKFHYLYKKYFSELPSITLDEIKEKVIVKMREAIERDFIIHDDTKARSEDKHNRSIDLDFDVKVDFCKSSPLTSIVLDFGHPKEEEEINGDEDIISSVNIYNPKTFMAAYLNDFSLVSPELNREYMRRQVENKMYEKVYKLDRAAEIFLVELIHDWLISGFEVCDTENRLVIVKIVLHQRGTNNFIPLTGQGIGVVDALLSAVDYAISYLCMEKIINKKMPNRNDIDSFKVSDRDKSVKAEVSYEIVFKFDGKHYLGRGHHRDTIKSVLQSYALALQNVIKENEPEDNRWIDSIDQIKYLYDRGKRNFRKLEDIYLKFYHSITSKLTDIYNWIDIDIEHSSLKGLEIHSQTMVDFSCFKVKSEKVEFWRSNFSKSDFSQTEFFKPNIEKCEFHSHTKMNQVVWNYCNIENSVFSKDTEMICPSLNRCQIVSTKMMGMNLSNADLTGSILRDVDFTDANLTGANFSNAILIDVNFTGTKLKDAIFDNVMAGGTTNLEETLRSRNQYSSKPTVDLGINKIRSLSKK